MAFEIRGRSSVVGRRSVGLRYVKETSHHDVLASARLAFCDFWETLVNVHGRFSIVGHALGL